MEREQHGDYWLAVSLVVAAPQSVWEWKVYRDPGGRIVATDRAASEEEARAAARAWIAEHNA